MENLELFDVFFDNLFEDLKISLLIVKIDNMTGCVNALYYKVTFGSYELEILFRCDTEQNNFVCHIFFQGISVVNRFKMGRPIPEDYVSG